MIRNRWRRGRYLVRSDESGRIGYDDETVKLWDGRIVLRDEYEERNPQDFVKALRDPYPLKEVRPQQALDTPVLLRPIVVGTTGVTAPTGPASHLFDPGIGEMSIGTTFVVR